MKLLPQTRWGRIRVAILALLLLSLIPAMFYFTSMPGRSYSGPLQPLTAEETIIRDNLKRHITMLADTIGERNSINYEALQEAAAYIEHEFRSNGYEVAFNDYEVNGKTFRNIEVQAGNSNAVKTIVVGAHYDSAPGTPGANDNASGVAAVLEIARLLKNSPPLSLKVLLVAFVNEEPPCFYTRNMGSRVYAKQLRRRHEKVAGMFSIETIGYYSDVKGSQNYPPIFSLFYPDKGNFITFVGNVSSRTFTRRAAGIFRETTMFPSEGCALPSWVSGLSLSDHSSFWLNGYRAVMITDTAMFRYPHYHTAQDTPDKVDYERTARVVAGLHRMVTALTSQ